jgi:hypothetical protein
VCPGVWVRENSKQKDIILNSSKRSQEHRKVSRNKAKEVIIHPREAGRH